VLFEPYVLRMWVEKKNAADNDAVVTVENLTMLAQRTTRQFLLSDVTRPIKDSMHPMVSFRAKDKNYFIHPEVLEDAQLVKQLMGDDFVVLKKQPPSHADEDDY
jgi:hypothetical protein